MPSDRVRQEYARLARNYDRRWAGYLSRSIGRTLRKVRVEPGDRVLDVGCGTGMLLREVARRGGGAGLVGVDSSLAMLLEARRCATPAALIAADAGALPLGDGAFDVVISTSSLHYWSDPAAGLGEATRVARPGAVVVITDWCGDDLGCRLVDWWLRLTGRATYTRLFGVDECRRMLADAGVEVSSVERYRAGLFWGLMTLSGRRRATSAARP